jgi:hypothetical protein
VRRVALTAADGFLQPLMRDADEVVIARTEAENFRHKQRYIRSREEQERKILQERDARLRRKEKQRRAKERRRRRGRRTPAKVIAHLKGRLKQLIGLEVR